MKKRALAGMVVAAVAAVPLLLGARQAQAQTAVGLELALLTDVSTSVDAAEYNLMKQGYVTAFQSAAVQNAIVNSVGGSIAVTYIEWSDATSQSVRIGWTLINSAATANAFAALLNANVRAFNGNTAPGSAINFATPLFASNAFTAPRQVIDVAGDGAANIGADTATARNSALTAGIDQINGLAIGAEANLETWYHANVKGGANAFVIAAPTFDAFALALQNKLISEVPEPASLLVLSGALVTLGVARRRRSRV